MGHQSIAEGAATQADYSANSSTWRRHGTPSLVYASSLRPSTTKPTELRRRTETACRAVAKLTDFVLE